MNEVITKITSCKFCNDKSDILIEWFGNEKELLEILKTIVCNKCEAINKGEQI
jgi:hypothetical protein